jgi:hypothetical protein
MMEETFGVEILGRAARHLRGWIAQEGVPMR